MKDNSLIRLILWLKSIYNTLSPENKKYASFLADNARKRLVEKGIIKDPDHDPIVGKYTSYEKGIKNLGLSPDYDISPEQQTIQDLQNMGIDVSPLKHIMPNLFASTTTAPTTPATTTTSKTTQGTVVPTYGKTSAGQTAPTGTVPIRDFLKDVYKIPEDAFEWDNTKGLTLNINGKKFTLGKPTREEEGQIINGTWYTNPNYVETVMSMNGIKRQKDPIREALPKYLESKGIKGATVTWNKDTKQVILKVGDKEFQLGTPQQIGSLYNGTTYVNQSEIEKVLSPFAKELGIEIGNKKIEDMTTNELQLQEKINQAGVMEKTYQQILKDLDDGNDDLLNKIHDIYKGLIEQSVNSLEKSLAEAKQAFAGLGDKYDEYQKTAYEEIDKSVEAAKARSKEEMAARGIYFSGLTTRALNQLEAQGISEKNKVKMQILQWKAQIDAQIAILTANTKMSEAQLTNELLAREALEKLRLLEKNQDKKDAIQQQIRLLDAQIEIDKLNLPLEEELNRRQQEIQNQQQAMDFFNKVYYPMLKLKYQDKWKQEDLDLAFMQYQQTVMSFFNDTEKFWAKLGFDKEKFRQQMMWDKQKFAMEMNFKERELASKLLPSSSSSSEDVETWVQRYFPYIKMQPDKLNAMIRDGSIVDAITQEKRTLSEDDKRALTAISHILTALEPKNRGNFLNSFEELSDVFSPDGAIQLLNTINTNIPEAILLKQLAVDYGSLEEFAKRYTQATEEQKNSYITALINKFKKEYKIKLDNNTIISVFTFIQGLFGGNGEE